MAAGHAERMEDRIVPRIAEVEHALADTVTDDLDDTTTLLLARLANRARIVAELSRWAATTCDLLVDDLDTTVDELISRIKQPTADHTTDTIADTPIAGAPLEGPMAGQVKAHTDALLEMLEAFAVGAANAASVSPNDRDLLLADLVDGVAYTAAAAHWIAGAADDYLQRTFDAAAASSSQLTSGL